MMARLTIAFFIVVFAPLVSFADTSEFLIRVYTGEDLNPPSTPTMLSVDPVATTQIDIVWSTAVDDVLLSGYVLFRDGVAIATTTLTTYMDTGLAPETLYEYEVYAFDWSGNISITSNALATTTLAIPVVPPVATTTDNGSPSATLVFRLLDLDIVTARNSALLQFETSLPSRFALRWGRTNSYDDGFVINDTYQRVHQTIINELEPGTSYLYELIGYSPTGREVLLERGEFTTTEPSFGSPSNVQNLRVTIEDTTPILTWQMPDELTDARVRIVRSHLGYPNDPYDGAVVFEGFGTSFADLKALSFYDTEYYSVFVIAADGSVSSGAVIAAHKSGPKAPGTSDTVPITTTSTPNSLPELPDLEIEEGVLDFGFSTEYISVIQSDQEFNFKSDGISLVNDRPFVIRIPYTSLPDNLKSIVVTLLDPTDSARSYSFLLRINKDRTAYEATIAPLNTEGESRIQIEIFDFERQLVGRYQKLIKFITVPDTTAEVIFPDKIISFVSAFFSGLWSVSLVFLLILFLLYRRSRETEDKL